MANGTCSIEGCGRVEQLRRGWCRKHYLRWLKSGDPNMVAYIVGDDEARLWGKVDVRGPDECWPWKGKLNHGYGMLMVRVSGRSASRFAHRLAYEFTVGPIPDGLHLDHVCHVPEECRLNGECPHRRCCNPAHLQPVTPRENTLRSNNVTAVNAAKTHCIRGHEFTEANTYRPNGYRRCRTCMREATRKWEAKRRSKNLEAA